MTEQDFRTAPYNNMYEVVNALRSNWRAPVAVDGVLVGEFGELRYLRPSDVQSVQLLRMHEAMTLFRRTRVLMVTTKRGGSGGTVAGGTENGR